VPPAAAADLGDARRLGRTAPGTGRGVKALEKAMENGEIWDFIWIYMGMIWELYGIS